MWYYEAVSFMLEKGYMNGISETEFSPAGTLTRAQLVTILYRIAGSPEAEGKNSFKDVPSGNWYSTAVNWATANGIVNGFEDSTFRPNDAVTREQIAVILYRSNNSPESNFALDKFGDADQISDYALAAMRWAAEQGLISGDETVCSTRRTMPAERRLPLSL